MKSGVSLIIPAGLLLFLNSAEAGIFLKAKDPFIIQGKKKKKGNPFFH